MLVPCVILLFKQSAWILITSLKNTFHPHPAPCNYSRSSDPLPCSEARRGLFPPHHKERQQILTSSTQPQCKHAVQSSGICADSDKLI